MKKIATAVSKMAIFRGILLLLGVLCLIIGIVTSVFVDTSNDIPALVAGVVLFFVGICIIYYIFLEWKQNRSLKRIKDENWMTERKELLKGKLRNKTELELMRELGKICDEKYHLSKSYYRKREELGISPEMVLNSEKEAKRRAIIELLKEVYGWK